VLWGVLLGPVGWIVMVVQGKKEDDNYRRWSAKRYQEKLKTVEDPVDKWSREHPDAAGLPRDN